MADDLASTLQYLRDKAEIEDVLKLYCRAVDRLDKELLKWVYHPEGTDNHGSFSGKAHEFTDYIIDYIGKSLTCGFHTITQSIIEIEGDRAFAESMYFSYSRIHGGWRSVSEYFGEAFAARSREAGTIELEHDYVAGGRYLDELVRHEGRWKIMRRQLTNEWSQGAAISHDRNDGLIAKYNLPGKMDRSDPVYQLALRRPDTSPKGA